MHLRLPFELRKGRPNRNPFIMFPNFQVCHCPAFHPSVIHEICQGRKNHPLMHLWTRIFVSKDTCRKGKDICRQGYLPKKKRYLLTKLKSTAGLSMVEHASPMTRFRISKTDAFVKSLKEITPMQPWTRIFVG